MHEGVEAGQAKQNQRTGAGSHGPRTGKLIPVQAGKRMSQATRDPRYVVHLSLKKRLHDASVSLN